MRDRRFPWTCHKPGDWSAVGVGAGYEIRGKPGSWRILRGGVHWDLVATLTEAKRLCEIDEAHHPATPPGARAVRGGE